MKLVQIDKESPQKAQKEMRLPVQYCNNYFLSTIKILM